MKKGGTRKVLLAVILAISIFSLAHTNEIGAQASWTFMVYMDGDNNLEGAAIDDLNEMEFSGSTGSVNIVAQIDRIPGYDSSNGDWTTTRRYYVTQDANGYDGIIVSTLIADLGEQNMGDFQTLANFVNWAMTTYPAQNYALVLWDHGSGWKRMDVPVKGVCWDDTDGFDYLTQPEIRRVLSGATGGGTNNLEIVGFDACLMGMLEIDYDIMPYADYRVGSEEVEPWDGWDYQATLSALVANPGMTPAQLATRIVNDYMSFYGYGSWQTQSAVDLSKVQALVTATDTLATHLWCNIATNCTQVHNARASSESYSDPDYIDLYHFTQLINSGVSDSAIKTDAQNVMNALTGAVVAEGHGTFHSHSHGVSIYYPLTSAGYLSNYETDVLLPVNTNWGKFVKNSYACTPPAALTCIPVDVIFCIDVTGSMWDDIASVKAQSTTIVNFISLLTSDFRVGIIAYRDHPILPYGNPGDVMFEDYAFSRDTTTIINNINSLNVYGGADEPEAVYDALLRTIDASSIGGWRKGVNKVIILMGDAPPHDPCPICGYTLWDVIIAALNADPAHVYSVCVGIDGVIDPDVAEAFGAISRGTGGEAFSAPTADDVVDALLVALRTAVYGQPSGEHSEYPPNYNNMMRSLAQENMKRAESLISACQEAIVNAPSGKDITKCEQLLEQAKEALERAHMYFTGKNYIAANYWALKAIESLKECIECAGDP